MTITSTEETAVESKDQTLIIIRHGDRWDYSHPEWKKTATRPGDPSLSTLGHRQARETGSYLDNLLATEGYCADDITFLSSPFLRCVQTSNEILSEFRKTPGDVAETVKIKPEYSVFELDTNGRGGYHASLPDMVERKSYFPRLDETHESMFVPTLPESKDGFLQRCDLAMQHINKKYPFDESSSSRVIIVVTHAAGCIGLTKSAAGLELTDVKAAYPCVINRLTRSTNSETWDIDAWDKEDGGNGYCAHLSDFGTHTIPWNHFGDKSVNNGYTGPPADLHLAFY